MRDYWALQRPDRSSVEITPVEAFTSSDDGRVLRRRQSSDAATGLGPAVVGSSACGIVTRFATACSRAWMLFQQGDRISAP
jgi:hypothetical protein